MHSRNSCKTLKCPRCNWHYKYQETLEIHMKEKHPENELNCLYCLTNQSHPRLARGETYTCGYKPYRCEVCNYSTTTKGNLSIHMTSDKHMTNIQHYDASSVAAANELGQQMTSALAAAAAGGAPSASAAAGNGAPLCSQQADSNQSGEEAPGPQPHPLLANPADFGQEQEPAGACSTPSSASASPSSANTSNNSVSAAASNPQAAPAASPASREEAPAPVQASAGPQSQQQQQQNAALTVAAAILLAQQNPNSLDDYINSPEIAKDSYDDPSRKYKCHRCKVAFTRQSYLTAHNKTLFHRKGEKLAYPMEKYLDPNRPFKCDICKESFTQKSILLVHNNSVSHLHKLNLTKKAGQEQQQSVPQPAQVQVQQPPQHHHQQPPSQAQQQQQLQQQLQQATQQLSQQQQSQQPAQNPLAALAGGDPMSALMMSGANPMAALMVSGAMPQSFMPFMMNPHLMAAAALAAAQTSRMLDPMGQNLFGQAGQVGAGGNPFADFQSQQQQLMQQAASQLAAAAAASGSGPACSNYSLGNLLNPAISSADLLQQSIAPTAVVNSSSASISSNPQAGGKSASAIHSTSAVSDANLVSSTLDSLHSRQQQYQANQQQASQQAGASNGLEAAQAQAAAAAAAALSVQQQKRARTRISEEQLRILRQYFDINNSPTEEQLQEMSVKSELPLKVIKHWFRNTLFKERQKNKDSPYNFNNPPMLALNLEEYERTGEAKVTPINDLVAAHGPSPTSALHLQEASSQRLASADSTAPRQQVVEGESIEASAAAVVRAVVAAVATTDERPTSTTTTTTTTPSSFGEQGRATPSGGAPGHLSPMSRLKCKRATRWPGNGAPDASPHKRVKAEPDGEPFSANNNNLDSNSLNANNITSNTVNHNTDHSRCDSDSQGDSDNAASGEHKSLRRSKRATELSQKAKLSPVSDENAGIGPSSTWSPLQLQQQLFDQTWASVNHHLNNQGLSSKTSDSSSHSINSSTNSKSKRANRTRFSDRQVKVLQEFFETNAYPKDDDLEALSKQLGLSARVIVVWFQNARQKARKVYENRPTSASMSEPEDDAEDTLHLGSNAGGHHQHHQTPGSQTGGRRGAGDSLSGSRHLNARLLAGGQLSPMSQGDGESSMGGLHSPSGSMADYNSGLWQHPNSAGAGAGAANQQQQLNQQQEQLEDLFMSNLDNDSNRGEADDGREADEDEEEDDDEFMSAAQMMRHQQQQAQQHQAQQHQLNPAQQHSQQLAAAAAAAGLFGGDASNLLSLIAANQQAAQAVGANNLLGADLHQRSMMEAINSAMRGAVHGVNGAGLTGASVGQVTGANVGGNSNNNSFSLNESSNASIGNTSNMSDRNTSSSASQRDKRLRTQISPEQLDYLYQKYQVESNPSRKTLESIAQDVGLSKRVVQVWFQNTRARERRGQLRMSQVVAQQQRNQNNNPNAGSAAQAAAAKLSQQQQQPNQAQVPPQLNGNGSNAAAAAAAVAALMRGQLLEGTPGFAPLDLSGCNALFAGLK